MSDNILDNLDENDEIDRLILLKRNIRSFFNKKELIDFFRSIVDQSQCLSFTSARTKKFIVIERPVLSLELDVTKASKIYTEYNDLFLKSDKSNIESVRKERTLVVNREIITPINELMTAVFKLILNGEIPKEYNHYRTVIDQVVDIERAIASKDSINNFFQLKDADGNIMDGLGFLYSVTSGISFMEDSQLNIDTRVFIEIMY